MKRFVGAVHASGGFHLETALQPYSEAGCSVLCSGYVANGSALIQEACRRGEALPTTSDAALFANAYRWWGHDLQSRVVGEYAAALIDHERRQLFLTHDALGVAAVFYCERADGLLFASRLDDLVRAAGYSSLDEEYIADYLATGFAATERTPYSGIRRLLPGHSLDWSLHRTIIRRTWDLTRIQPVTLRDDAEYEERFRSLLLAGVAAALPADGKVWGELSGGLDSSSIVSAAVHAGARNLEAVSFVYSQSTSADESAWIDLVVQQHRIPSHRIDADESRPFAELPEHRSAEPLHVNTAAGLVRRLNLLAEASGVAVVLSGHGGDQVCGGDSPKPYDLADLFPLHPVQLRRALKRWQAVDRSRRSIAYRLREDVLRPRSAHRRRRSLTSSAALALPSWLDPTYVGVMSMAGRSTAQLAPRCRSVGQQYLTERIWKAAVDAAGEDDDPFERRYPFLYRPLVEFMLAIPWEQRVRPGQDRSLQRRALKGILPEPVRQRTWKAGPAEAEVIGLRNDSPWLAPLLVEPRVVARGYVDATRWHEAVSQARFGRIVSMRDFVATATLEVWLRQLEARC